MNIKHVFLISFFLLASWQTYGQYSDFKYKKKNHSTDAGYLKATKQTKYLSGGIGLNLLNYFGDLTPNEKLIINAFKVTRPGISAFVNYNYSSNIFFKGELLYGRITGDDFNSDPYKTSTRKYIRNLNFRNDLVGLTLAGNFNIFQDPFEYFKRRNFNIYLTVGLAIFYSDPKAKVLPSPGDETMLDQPKNWVSLRPLGTEGQNNPELGVKKYSAIQFGIPFGGGVRIRLGHRTDLCLEASLYYLLTDYIDDIGSSYVDLGALDSDLAKELSDRSQESIAAVKNEMRDLEIIQSSTTPYSYVSAYDGETYTVYEGFGQEGGIRGAARNDLFVLTSFKISYIFTK